MSTLKIEMSVVQANREAMRKFPKPPVIHSFIQHPDGSLEDTRWRTRKENIITRKQIAESQNDL